MTLFIIYWYDENAWILIPSNFVLHFFHSLSRYKRWHCVCLTHISNCSSWFSLLALCINWNCTTTTFPPIISCETIRNLGRINERQWNFLCLFHCHICTNLKSILQEKVDAVEFSHRQDFMFYNSDKEFFSHSNIPRISWRRGKQGIHKMILKGI